MRTSTLPAAINILRENRKVYLIANFCYYGLILCAMGYSIFDRSYQQALGAAVLESLGEMPLGPIFEALTAGQVVRAVVLIFGINLVLGSFLWITLPSLIVPFSGLLLAGVRALIWGFLFAPQLHQITEFRDFFSGLLIALLLLFEGQGYVLASLGAYLHGRAFLWPVNVGAAGHRSGYGMGLALQGKLYLLVAPVLLLSAIYEVVIALGLVPSLY